MVVTKLDRLARSLSHMARLGDELQTLGIELVSLSEGLDTTTAMGRAMFGMCGVFAQLEADLVAERTRAGVAAARRRGKRLGRPRAFVPVAKARRLLERGLSQAAVARELAVSRTTLQRALARG